MSKHSKTQHKMWEKENNIQMPGTEVAIHSRNRNFENIIRVFRKMINKEGLIREYRNRHSHFLTNSQKIERRKMKSRVEWKKND